MKLNVKELIGSGFFTKKLVDWDPKMIEVLEFIVETSENSNPRNPRRLVLGKMDRLASRFGLTVEGMKEQIRQLSCISLSGSTVRHRMKWLMRWAIIPAYEGKEESTCVELDEELIAKISGVPLKKESREFRF